MFSEVNQSSVNLCACCAAKNAFALAQKAHHGGRGEGPFGPLYAVCDGSTGPAAAGVGGMGSVVGFQMRAGRCWNCCAVTVSAMALVAMVS